MFCCLYSHRAEENLQMLHTETVIPSTLDLLKKIQGLPNVSGLTYFDDAEADPLPEMLIPITWSDVKRKIESVVREFVKTV